MVSALYGTCVRIIITSLTYVLGKFPRVQISVFSRNSSHQIINGFLVLSNTGDVAL